MKRTPRGFAYKKFKDHNEFVNNNFDKQIVDCNLSGE